MTEPRQDAPDFKGARTPAELRELAACCQINFETLKKFPLPLRANPYLSVFEYQFKELLAALGVNNE